MYEDFKLTLKAKGLMSFFYFFTDLPEDYDELVERLQEFCLDDPEIIEVAIQELINADYLVSISKSNG
jgi:hypothetical protein